MSASRAALSFPSTGESLPLFAVPAPPTSVRINLTPAVEREALAKLDLIQPLLDYLSLRDKYAGLRLGNGDAVTNSNRMAAYIAETRTLNGKTLSARTVWRWLRQYEDGGLPALARKPREDAGSSRFFTRYPAAAQLAAAEYLKPYATAHRAFEAIQRDRELLRIPVDELPSYQTVLSYLDSLPAATKTLAREGQRIYNERFTPHVTRAYTDIDANQIWVADHMLHDVEVANDCFAGLPKDAPLRPRLTAVMDMRSRKLVGYCWAAEGDSRSIATALRRALERYGPPQLFYCDNGRDFKKVTRGAAGAKSAANRRSPFAIETAFRELDQLGIFRLLGIEAQFCRPYHPQSKNIERCFGFIHQSLDAILPHYTTGNAYTRPDATVLAGSEHRKLQKLGLGARSPLMPASDFIRLASTWVEQDYNRDHQHGGRGMDGRTPNEIFEAGYPAHARRTADPAVLATMLHERLQRKLQDSAITIEGRRFMPPFDDAQSWAAINNTSDPTVNVLFDPLDPDFAIVVDGSGRKLAALVAETLTPHSAAAQPQIAAIAQVSRRLLKSNAIVIQGVHRGVALAGHKSAVQHLAERAAAPGTPVEHLLSQRQLREAVKPNAAATAPISSWEASDRTLEDLLA